MIEGHELRILSVIADLERANAGGEVDEFSVARASGTVPATMPRHNYVNSPRRARLLQVLTDLEQAHLIYVTKSGYWGLHLTRKGRERLATADPDPAAAPPMTPQRAPMPPPDPVRWDAPRPATARLPSDRGRWLSISGLALAITTLGAALIFVFSNIPNIPRSALARRDAATPLPAVAATPRPNSFGALRDPTTTPAGAPNAPPPAAPRFFLVANTGGAGVYLRRSPRLADRLNAWPENTRLQEIGPETVAEGLTWRHVRAPDGTEGFVPAQYTGDAPP